MLQFVCDVVKDTGKVCLHQFVCTGLDNLNQHSKKHILDVGIIAI